MDNILRVSEVEERTGLSRITIWRKVRAGAFPPPIQLSENTIGWPEADVAAWRDAQPRRTYGASQPAPEAA
jgi:prophage regulatory protein